MVNASKSKLKPDREGTVSSTLQSCKFVARVHAICASPTTA